MVLMTFTVLGPLISYNPGSYTGDGNPLRQAVYIIALIMALVAANLRHYPKRLLAIPLSVSIILTWFVLSLSWSAVPEIAMRRLLLTIIIIWSVFMAINRAGYDKTLAAIRYIMPFVLVANYAAVFIAPSFGIHQVSEEDPSIIGAWRGIMMQKNFAGAMCAFTILFFVLDAKKLKNVLRVAVVLGATYFLYRTQSKTSIGIVVMSLVLGYLYTLYDKRNRPAVIIGVGVLLFVLFLLSVIYWNQITAPFHSQDAFTGRVQIWPVLIAYWLDHWLLGSGYGSFWNIGADSPVFEYNTGWVAHIYSGHNGYLDILVQTGIIGLVLSVGLAILWPLVKLLISPSIDRAHGGLIIGCIWFSALHNLTESSLFDRDQIPHVFLIIALALLVLETRSGPRRGHLIRRAHAQSTDTKSSSHMARNPSLE
jgi:O-antigen ligase